jgi:anti-sigma B factor antagonist
VIINKQTVGKDTVLVLEGAIKLGESAQFFASNLERTLESEGGHVLVDFSGIREMDSTGLGELVGYLGRFKDRGRKLVLVNPTGRVRRLLQIAGLEELFAIYDTVEEAVAAEGS